ncbi:MAG: lycopene beta-cyclase CrtY [Deltaproteobacteria bacterium]|nr:lycopene beta-cyclase CrtY [Deltaproteobacteria bacterium]
MSSSTDVLLVGGGLQSGLIALAYLHARPDLALTIVEAGERLGGNHTWSFHGTDVPAEATPWLTPLEQVRWSGYDVFFEDHTRTLQGSYASLTGEHLHRVVSDRVGQAPNAQLLLGHRVKGVDGRGATLEDGRRLEASLVVDCRGPGAAPLTIGWEGGWQKFVGLEVELAQPHSLVRPILMDARVEQRDGFRFLYVLPLSPTTLLVEDTVFSDHKDLDVPALRAGAEAYCAENGWAISKVIRQEQGSLPMPVTPVAVSRGPALAGGYAGGWFHPGTGYSTPVALRLACFLAAQAPEDAVGASLRALAGEIEHQQRYALLLNELLFLRCKPELRWDIFSRFYRLPEDTIGRFYALQTQRSDRMRALIGLPPKGVSIPRALGAVTRYVRERHGGGR